MKRAGIITIAGSSTRFSKSAGNEVHKAIYFEDDGWTILSYQLNLVKDVSDEIIIVTGYKHNEIVEYVNENFSNLPVKFVYNEHFSDFGSAYSLILGIEAVSDDTDETIFLEGDLVFDDGGFKKLLNAKKDVITSNNKMIDAKTAVVFYINENGRVNYLYDTNHKVLEIKEPFFMAGNSGQVWKFVDIKRLKDNLKKYTKKEWTGTNLVPINDYFREVDYKDIEFVEFKEWFNCNTVFDYRLMKSMYFGEQ